MADKLEVEIVPQLAGAELEKVGKALSSKLNESKIAPQLSGGVLEKMGQALQGQLGKSAGSGITGALGKVGEISKVLGGGELGGALGSIGKAVGGIGQVTGALGRLSAVAGPAGPIIAAVIMGLEKVIGVLGEAAQKAIETVISFASKADPYAADRFNEAMEDVSGVIGQSMVPILERFTVVIRLVGDVLASILPTTEEMEAVMKELDPVFKDLRALAERLAPVIRQQVVGALELLVPMVVRWAHAMHILIEPLSRVLNLMARFRLIPQASPLKSSVGAGSGKRGTSFMSGEEFSRQQSLAAFATGAKPEEQTAANTSRMADSVKTLVDLTTLSVQLLTGQYAAAAQSLFGKVF